MKLGPETRAMNPPVDVVALAVQAANRSPCAKSKRGAVLWCPPTPSEHAIVADDLREHGMRIVSTGHNARVGSPCDGSPRCRQTCGKRCEHAEAAAIRWARATTWPRPLELLHAKTIDGHLVAGGPPSCWQCSKAILVDGRIGGVWLYRDMPSGPTWVRYSVDRFHALTLSNCGIDDARVAP